MSCPLPGRTPPNCQTEQVPQCSLDVLVERLSARPGREGSLLHVEVLPARAATNAPWPQWADPAVAECFRGSGVAHLWAHQLQAAELAHVGQHVVISTGTASGKSLAYLLPTLTAIARARGDRGRRGATALYLSPTKALANDQAATLADLGVPGLRLATHDGDSPPEQREWTRNFAEYVLTNPDMLHHSLLPGHERWARFLSTLQYVVIDEMHHYRGVFGAHVAQILRRLRRVCAAHGSAPTFVLASATVAEPTTAAARLTGLPFDAISSVTQDASPRGPVTLALWQPPFVPGSGENGAPVRRGAGAEVADLLTELVLEDIRTLAFVRSRAGAESVAQSTRRQLDEVTPGLGARVAAYRGGYLPEERRELERALRAGQLLGLATTTALELGIDVSGLDAVLLAGFPGSRAALWQQLGRAGRRAGQSLGVLVARDDPLDNYLVHHPEALLGRPVETFVFDPDNPHVLGPHLCAAAAELPLSTSGTGALDLFGPHARTAVDSLTRAGLLRRRRQGWYWTSRSRASDLADLRSTGGRPVRLVEEATGRVVGTVDPGSAPATVHPGAVYLHQGESWLVDDLDLSDSVASVRAARVAYGTIARDVTDIRICAEWRHSCWASGRLTLGEVEVTRQVVSYLKRRHPGGEVIGEVRLDLPPQTLRTQAVWWTIPDDVLVSAELGGRDLAGSAHAAEHAAIGLLPLFATCDRWDVGGVSTARHADTGELSVFVYDGHPGGAGFAERGYQQARAWLSATRDAVAACPCTDGCPSCVQSPKCGNQNHPLDKSGAVRLFDVLLG